MKGLNKKGFIDFTPRKIASYVLGVILLALGTIPLLFDFGVIGFNLEGLNVFVLWTIAMVGSVVMLLDAYHEIHEFGSFHKAVMIATFIVAILIFIYGVNSFGVLPFTLPPLIPIITDILLAIGGVLLIIGGFMGI